MNMLKIAGGVFLGLVAFWALVIVVTGFSNNGAEERAARDLIERQFAPAR